MKYNTEEIYKKFLVAIEYSGIEIPESIPDDLDLVECISDSLQFVSLVINIEEELGIVLPDNFLLIDNFHSLTGLVNQLQELVEADK